MTSSNWTFDETQVEARLNKTESWIQYFRMEASYYDSKFSRDSKYAINVCLQLELDFDYNSSFEKFEVKNDVTPPFLHITFKNIKNGDIFVFKKMIFTRIRL